jgi:hypothetical protein
VRDAVASRKRAARYRGEEEHERPGKERETAEHSKGKEERDLELAKSVAFAT